MFAITPIVLVILALAGGGVAKIGNSHDQDNNIVEACEIVQVAVADAGQAVFVPAVGAATGVIVGEVVPGLSIGAVIFADGTPGALAKVGAPVAPVGCLGAMVGETLVFGEMLVLAGGWFAHVWLCSCSKWMVQGVI